MLNKSEIASTLIVTLVYVLNMYLIVIGGPMWASGISLVALSLLTLTGITIMGRYIKERIKFEKPKN